MSSVRKRKAACALAIILIAEEENEIDSKVIKKRKHRFWVRPYVMDRPEYGAFEKLLLKMEIYDGAAFFNFLRMNEENYHELVSLVELKICKVKTRMRNPVSAAERVAITLRFLATGDSYVSLSYLFRVGKSTITEFVPEVCEVLYQCLKERYLKLPSSEGEWLKIANDYGDIWNFNRVIDGMDGKHIVMKAPSNSGSEYFNYKGSHSIVLLALVDAKYKFLYIDVGTNGRISDGGIFQRTKLREHLENENLPLPPAHPLIEGGIDIPYVIVADEAFPLKTWLMKPYPGRGMDPSQRIFNYRLSRARRVTENAFGILVSRFRVFAKPFELDPKNVEKITMAACVLHNYLMSKQEVNRAGRYIVPPEDSIDMSILLESVRQQGTHNYSRTAKGIRDEMKDYFCGDGAVDWQWDKV